MLSASLTESKKPLFVLIRKETVLIIAFSASSSVEIPVETSEKAATGI
jgi:hypothetical protein